MIGAIISGAISVLAGLFLATVQSRGADSMIQVLANGIGWYFIARGVYMISSSAQSKKVIDLLTAAKDEKN